MLFTNYLKNLDNELKNNKLKKYKFELSNFYEINNFQYDFLIKLSSNNILFKNFFEIFEDLKKEYKENDNTNYSFTRENDINNNYIKENIDLFIKEKKLFLKKFFKLNKNVNQESIEKNILSESNIIFLDKLQFEIKNSLKYLLNNFRLYLDENNKKDNNINKENSTNNMDLESKKFDKFKENNNERLLSHDKSYGYNISDNNSISVEELKIINSFEQIYKKDIKIILSYLQIFIFEKNFILYLSNINSFFYGIKSYIFIDKQENITLDFYADLPQYKNLANDYNYLMHLKVMINTHFINYSKEENYDCESNTDITKENLLHENTEIRIINKNLELEKEMKKYTTNYFDDNINEIVYVNSIKEKNLIPFHKINEADITLHPPHIEFNFHNENFYRKYNNLDQYAIDSNNYDLDLKYKNRKLDFINIVEFQNKSNYHDEIESNNGFIEKKDNIADNIYIENLQNIKDKKFFSNHESNHNEEDGALLYYVIPEITEFDDSPYQSKKTKTNEINNCFTHKENENIIFRNIDKLRLLKMSLNLVLDFEALKSYPQYLTFQIIRNEKSYKESLKSKIILNSYLSIFNNEKITKMNEVLRNYYGEKFAYYFYYVSHYIRWLIFPSILGIIFVSLEFIFKVFNVLKMRNFESEDELKEKNISLRVYYVYVYLFFIIIWAVINIKYWTNKQKYYNYCWGMDRNLLDSKIKTENFEKTIVTMGIHIPIKSRRKVFLKNAISFCISLILIIFTISINFLLFELSKIKVFNKDQATSIDTVIGAGVKIVGRKNNKIASYRNNTLIIKRTLDNNLFKFSNTSLLELYNQNSFILIESESKLEDKINIKKANLRIDDHKNNFTNKHRNMKVIKNNDIKSQSYLFTYKKNVNDTDIDSDDASKDEENNTSSNQKSINEDSEEENKNVKNGEINQKLTSNGASIDVIDLEHIKIQPTIWYHLIPVISVILRNLMSKINYSIAKWMVNFEKHTEENNADDSFLIKMICYEFVNYYFYLYYIIFYKQYHKLCSENNCYKELGSQLTTIIITSTLLNFIELILPVVTILIRNIKFIFFKKKKEINRNSIKNQENKNNLNKDSDEKKNDSNEKNKDENPRNKYYFRIDFYDIMTYEYMELIMNFGYIILFGISSPICFLIALIYAFVERFTDALKFTKSHNVNIIGIFLFTFD